MIGDLMLTFLCCGLFDLRELCCVWWFDFVF